VRKFDFSASTEKEIFFYRRRCNAARAELFSLMSSQKVVDVSRTQGGVRNSNLKVRIVFFVNNL
jgi:hypothetical protein